MATPAVSVRNLLLSTAALAAAVALVLVPQLGYLQQCRQHLQLVPLLALNLGYALALGLLAQVVLHALSRRRSELVAVVTRRGRMVLLVTGGLSLTAVALLTAGVSDHERSSFALSLLWLLCLLAGILGWGRLLNRLLLPEHRLDWGQQAAFGLALTIAVGGLLNLIWAVSPTTIILYLALGAGLLWADHGLDRQRLQQAASRLGADPIRILPVLLVIVLVVIQVAGSVAGTVDTALDRPAFDPHDDNQAYLVFAEKMISLGSLGAEPYEARRMLSMGGQTFLQAMVLAVLPVRAVHLVEGGLALLILLGLVTGGARRYQLDSRLTLFMALLVLAFPHLAMRGNTSALLTGVVLLVSWFRLYADQVLEQPGLATGALVALIAGALCALKSTLIPAVVVLLATTTVLFWYRQREHRRRTLLELAVIVGLIVVLVLPWMISIYESSATLLYPILGKGFYGGVHTDDFASISGDGDFDRRPLRLDLRAVAKHLLRLLPVLLLLVFVRDRQPRQPVTAIALAIIVSVILLVGMGDPAANRSQTRYAYPLLMAGWLCLSLAGLQSRRSRSPISTATVVVVTGLLMISQDQDRIFKMYDQLLYNAAAALTSTALVSDYQQQAAATMQEVIPPGRTVLVTIGHPYLLDPVRNPLAIMSLPGMASPPPGLPIDRGAEAVSDYLLGQGISYLVYGGRRDLTDLLDLSEQQIRSRYPRSKMRWVMLRYHQRYQQVVEQLALTRKRLYQDAQTIVLDLAQPTITFVPQERPDQIDGFHDGIWTKGNGVINQLDCPPGARYLILRTKGWHPWSAQPQRLGLKLLADGQALKRLRAESESLVFELPSQPRRIKRLRIISPVLDTALIGAAAGQAPLGIDVRALEIVSELRSAELPIGSTRQSVSGALDPAWVWQQSGFYRDHGWTNGDARLAGLSWPVPSSHDRLVLSLYAVHPDGNQLDQLGIRLLVNGIELALSGSREHELHFQLYHGLGEIHHIRIVSNTFIPQQRNGSNDKRRLGIPIRLLATE